MSHIKTVFAGNMNKVDAHTEAMGCGECQTSCQSACKTSYTVANQNCEKGKGTSPLRRSQIDEALVNAAKPVSA